MRRAGVGRFSRNAAPVAVGRGALFPHGGNDFLAIDYFA
jgi:hypothetical protein